MTNWSVRTSSLRLHVGAPVLASNWEARNSDNQPFYFERSHDLATPRRNLSSRTHEGPKLSIVCSFVTPPFPRQLTSGELQLVALAEHHFIMAAVASSFPPDFVLPFEALLDPNLQFSDMGLPQQDSQETFSCSVCQKNFEKRALFLKPPDP